MEHLINNQIKEREVLLIKFDGDSGGIVSTVDALQMAQDEGMDLIEVSKSKNGKPAVCKISNYGKLKYKESKLPLSINNLTLSANSSNKSSSHN